jgi:hypothetical protein
MTWIAAGANEVFGLSQYGVLERFDGTESRVVYRFPRDHSLGAGIAYVREGELVAVHQLSGFAARYRDGIVDTEVIPDANLAYFNAAGQVPSLGSVIASEEGEFFVDDGNGWSLLGNSFFSLRVLSITPTEDGFLWGGEFGALGEYRRDGGFCAPEVLHPHDVWHVREAGGLIYLLNRGDQGIAVMVVLRRI